jgi:hypothetical protein
MIVPNGGGGPLLAVIRSRLRVLAVEPSYFVPRARLLTVRTVTPSAESPSLLARRARTCCWASADRAETSGPNGVPSSVEVAASVVGQVASSSTVWTPASRKPAACGRSARSVTPRQ